MGKIYTKSGDDGSTSLLSGERASKGHPRVELYGEVDELNARLGVAQALASPLEEGELRPSLSQVQNWLFGLGANLACDRAKRDSFQLPEIGQKHTTTLERQIDQWSEQLPPLKHFVLPGGSPMAGHLHLARTQARKVERLLVVFKDREMNREDGAFLSQAVIFFNRLSDYLFVAARLANYSCKKGEVLWKNSDPASSTPP